MWEAARDTPTSEPWHIYTAVDYYWRWHWRCWYFPWFLARHDNKITAIDCLYDYVLGIGTWVHYRRHLLIGTWDGRSDIKALCLIWLLQLAWYYTEFFMIWHENFYKKYGFVKYVLVYIWDQCSKPPHLQCLQFQSLHQCFCYLWLTSNDNSYWARTTARGTVYTRYPRIWVCNIRGNINGRLQTCRFGYHTLDFETLWDSVCIA